MSTCRVTRAGTSSARRLCAVPGRRFGLRERVALAADVERLFVRDVDLLAADEVGSPLAERIARVVEEAATRHPELLVGVGVGNAGLLDPEDLLVRALRLTGDRLRGVREGLGEIVSYLEFELNNHPRIEDPAHFLEAVEALRAKIED